MSILRYKYIREDDLYVFLVPIVDYKFFSHCHNPARDHREPKKSPVGTSDKYALIRLDKAVYSLL